MSPGLTWHPSRSKVAQLHALETGTEYSIPGISVEALAQEQPASFDVVTCMEMLEHVPSRLCGAGLR